MFKVFFNNADKLNIDILGYCMENLNDPKRLKDSEVNIDEAMTVCLLENDPLEEIFALNLGDFLCEHLISSEFAHKIGNKVKTKNESLKDQLLELISIYSIDSTLSILGFNSNEDYIIYNSIAKTIKLMLSLEKCVIYLAKKNEPIKLAGTSTDDINEEVNSHIARSYKKEEVIMLSENNKQIIVFPMKNKFECIGAIEVTRDASHPLEAEFIELLKITAGLFVTSLGIQKLIDQVKRVVGSDTVTTSELLNLRAQLTSIIGDLGDKQQAFVEKLAIAVDLKGKYKNNHSQRTADLSREICNFLELNEKTTDLIYYAGLLQNIGKITINDELLHKKGKLSKDEWDKLQEHPNAGVSLLMNINFMSEVVPYIHYQKERWDGLGKPEGLGGFSIPFGSRIIAVADAYCALTEDRPHRAALSNAEALEILKQESAAKWDPNVINALIKMKS